MCTTCQSNMNYIVIPETAKCVNPIAHIVTKAVKESMDSGISVVTVLTSLLNAGFVSNPNDLLCCPTCTDDSSFYFFGSADVFSIFTNDYLLWNGFGNMFACCVSYEANFATASVIESSLGSLGGEVECCNSDLSKTFNTLSNTSSIFSGLLDLGIVEVSNFNGVSSVGAIYNAVLEANKYADEEFMTLVFETILDIGVVIKCQDCKLIMVSANNSIDAFETLV